MQCTEQKVQIQELTQYKENAKAILDHRVEELTKIIQQQQVDVENARLDVEKVRISEEMLEKEGNSLKKVNGEQSEMIYSLNAKIEQLHQRLLENRL